MNHELAHLPGITVMGIATRASSAELNKIGDLWRRFHSTGDHKNIEARLHNAVYCVYCKYEGDYTQPFTVVLGCEVAEGTPECEGMRAIRINAGNFAVYTGTYESGNPVFAMWEEIWKTPLDRRYQADYDRYRPDDVTVHVGVK